MNDVITKPSVVNLEEAIKVIKSNYANSDKTINIIWCGEGEPLRNKIKLVNNTIGSSFSLKTKNAKNGIIGIANDIRAYDKKLKNMVSIICVPDSYIKDCINEIGDVKSPVYLIG